eukprot:921153-Lingulodinium_polyedra.AAC.1
MRTKIGVCLECARRAIIELPERRTAVAIASLWRFANAAKCCGCDRRPPPRRLVICARCARHARANNYCSH